MLLHQIYFPRYFSVNTRKRFAIMSTNDENRGQNWKESEIITLINIWADESLKNHAETRAYLRKLPKE